MKKELPPPPPLRTIIEGVRIGQLGTSVTSEGIARPCFVVRVVSQDLGTGYAVYDSNGAFLAMFSDPDVCQATVGHLPQTQLYVTREQMYRLKTQAEGG